MKDPTYTILTLFPFVKRYKTNMKKQKLVPFAFLGALLIIAIFIVGVQYGRKVAEVDKTIHFLISITPTKVITPTALPDVKYTTYAGKSCNIEFLYPSTLQVEKESSTGARFTNDKKAHIEFLCSPKESLLKKSASDIFTNETITVNGVDIPASKSADMYYFTMVNKKIVTQFSVKAALLPLLEKTLKLTK